MRAMIHFCTVCATRIHPSIVPFLQFAVDAHHIHRLFGGC